MRIQIIIIIIDDEEEEEEEGEEGEKKIEIESDQPSKSSQKTARPI